MLDQKQDNENEQNVDNNNENEEFVIDSKNRADETQNNEQYYSEEYENEPQKKKKKAKSKYSFGTLFSTVLITSLIVSLVFLSVGPLLNPALEEFWGVEREKEVIYIDSGASIEDDSDNFDNIDFESNNNSDNQNSNNNTNNSNTITDNVKNTSQYVIEKSDSTITKIAKKASPSVVGIKVTYDFFSYFFGEQTTSGEGSGVILSEEGHIITNYHVIQNALSTEAQNQNIQVYIGGETEESYPATIVGYEPSKDLAILKIEAQDLIPAEIGDSDNIEVGETAVAIGSPGGIGLIGSVTSGIISGLNREISLDGVDDMGWIQTDAAINPGNSGGALLNSQGQLIGINEAKITADGFEGLGFAIPINTAMEVYQRILEDKPVEEPKVLFGIYYEERYTKEFAEASGHPVGILVKDVIPTTGAYKAGIKVNDIITKLDKEPIESIDQFNEIKNSYEPGDVVEVEIYRDKEYIVVEVELTENFEIE